MSKKKTNPHPEYVKKTPEKRRDYVNRAVEGFIERLTHEQLTDTETLLFATLLQTVDDQTLQTSIRDRMDSWERRFEDLEKHLATQQNLQAAMSGRRQPPHRGAPNLNPLDGNRG